MKNLLSILVFVGVTGAITALVVSKREATRYENLLRISSAEWEAEKSKLETELRAAQKPARVATVVQPQIETELKASSREILDSLKKLRASSNDPKTARRILHHLETLIDMGNSALPVIREFLARNEEVFYESSLPSSSKSAKDGKIQIDFVFPPSLRFGLLDAVRQIGGDDAEKLLAEVLSTTGRGVEVGYLARVLQEMAPNKYRDLALSIARDLLAHPAAAGQPGDVAPSFTQRLFESEVDVQLNAPEPALSDWLPSRESVAADGVIYQTDMVGGGAVGTIKAFRDPFFFSAPDGHEYLLFTASDPKVASAWNGLIGLARRNATGWQLLAPLVRADDLNNELERPHVIEHDGMVYLFWSTQETVFNTNGPQGPTGLYGIVADHWGGTWRPLNGTGLVFSNPPNAPFQAYSFQVLPDLSVWSFADMPETPVFPVGAEQRRAAFVGGPAPVLHLRLDRDEAGLIVSQ